MSPAQTRIYSNANPRTRCLRVFVCLILTLACALVAPESFDPALYAQSSGESAETHVGLGYEALKRDQYEAAAAEFRAALALKPDLVLRARFPLAVALFEAHKPEEARREFEAVRRASGDHPNVCYYLGRLDIDERNYAAAIRNLKKAVLKPPFPDTSYYLGFAYLKQGEATLAVKYLEQALQSNEEDARVSYQLAQAYSRQGRKLEAKKMLALSSRTRQRGYDRSKLRTDCAQKLEQGPPDSARAVCDQLYENNNPDSLTALGSLYGQHGMLQDALKAFRRAAELAPHSPQTQYNLALTYYQLNELQQARTHLSSALLRWPDLFPLNSLYGAVLLKMGDDAAGARALRHAHELNPRDTDTTQLLFGADVRLAQASQASGDHAESLKLWQEAASLRPDDPLPHRGLAEIYSAMGKTSEAKAEGEQAEQLSRQ